MVTPTARNIETPVLTYQHPTTKSRVDLIGMVHHAEPDYYTQVQEIIDRRTAEGAVTHRELVSAVSQAEFDAAPRRVQRCLDYLGSIQMDIDALARKAGLVSQRDALVLSEDSANVERHDIDELTLGAKLNPYALGALALMMKVGTVLVSISPAEVRRQVIINALHAGDSGSFIPSALDVGQMTSISGDRDQAALTAADAHFAKNPQTGLLLPWGADHIPGLSAGFAERGFELTAASSLVAIHG